MAKGPVFQHRHYKAIASMIYKMPPDAYGHGQFADFCADMFAADNPRFDRKRFMDAACGRPSNGRDKVK